MAQGLLMKFSLPRREGGGLPSLAELRRLPWRRWLARFGPRLALLLALLLLVSTLVDAGWWVVTRYTTPETPAGATPPAAAPSAARRPQARYRDVAGLHLFGRSAGAAAPATADIRETRLQLKLLGVFASDDPARSFAIIADPQKREEVYQVGDALPGNVRLQAIHPDQVILERNGKLEKLMLPQEFLSTAPAAAPVAPGVRPAPAAAPQAEPKQSLREVWQTFRSNPEQVMRDIRITPAMGPDGRITGYRVNYRDRALLNRLGIRPTDTITAINGLPLTDPTAVLQLEGLLQDLQPFSVTLIRRGQEQTLDIEP